MPPPSDSAVGTEARELIGSFIQTARKDPATAADELPILLESLEGYANDFGGPYVELHETGRALNDLYSSSADKAAIDAQLVRLETQAGALPQN